jgi:hypothetical protein
MPKLQQRPFSITIFVPKENDNLFLNGSLNEIMPFCYGMDSQKAMSKFCCMSLKQPEGVLVATMEANR